jgi:hypothetical protein
MGPAFAKSVELLVEAMFKSVPESEVSSDLMRNITHSRNAPGAVPPHLAAAVCSALFSATRHESVRACHHSLRGSLRAETLA